MPTTIEQIFSHFNLNNYQKVRWGTTVNENDAGVYVVSTSNSPHENAGNDLLPGFAIDAMEQWIERLPFFLVDNRRPTLESLQNRLCEFWLPDENILYIGKADKRKNGRGIGERISEYYNCRLGYNSAHSGGQWIKTLANINDLHIYYAATENPSDVEHRLLLHFMDNVSQDSLKLLKDKELPLPYANLELKKGKRKRHGFKKQRW